MVYLKWLGMWLAELVFVGGKIGLFLIEIQSVALAPRLRGENSCGILDAESLGFFQLVKNDQRRRHSLDVDK